MTQDRPAATTDADPMTRIRDAAAKSKRRDHVVRGSQSITVTCLGEAEYAAACISYFEGTATIYRRGEDAPVARYEHGKAVA